MRQVTSSSGWCCILSSVIGIRGVFRAGFLFGVRMARGRHWALRWFLGHTLGFVWLRASRQPLAARPVSADRRSWRGRCVLVAGCAAVGCGSSVSPTACDGDRPRYGQNGLGEGFGGYGRDGGGGPGCWSMRPAIPGCLRALTWRRRISLPASEPPKRKNRWCEPTTWATAPSSMSAAGCGPPSQVARQPARWRCSRDRDPRPMSGWPHVSPVADKLGEVVGRLCCAICYFVWTFRPISDLSQTAFALSKGCFQRAHWIRPAQPERLEMKHLRQVANRVL